MIVLKLLHLKMEVTVSEPFDVIRVRKSIMVHCMIFMVYVSFSLKTLHLC